MVSITGDKSLKAYINALAFNDISDRGAILGLIVDQIITAALNKPASTKPGITPAIKSLPVDVCVTAPIMIKVTLGGISDPREPPAQIEAQDALIS